MAAWCRMIKRGAPTSRTKFHAALHQHGIHAPPARAPGTGVLRRLAHLLRRGGTGVTTHPPAPIPRAARLPCAVMYLRLRGEHALQKQLESVMGRRPSSIQPCFPVPRLPASATGPLLASFLYFDFCFAIWVLNGAMGPFISETFHLSAAQKGFMLSVPILAGAR